jgi:hypothetical protein
MKIIGHPRLVAGTLLSRTALAGGQATSAVTRSVRTGARWCLPAGPAEVVTAQGLALRAGVDWPDLGPDDLVVVPGWRSGTLARSGPGYWSSSS